MNKIFLIIQREFLNRVGKKSFLVATILIPLIFPAIITVLVYINNKSTENADKKVIHYVDESKLFTPDTSKYRFKPFQGSLDAAKEAYHHSGDLGLLYIPKVDIRDPQGITFYSLGQPTMEDEGSIRNMLSRQVKDMRMERLHIKKSTLDSLNNDVDIRTINLTPDGQEKTSNTTVKYIIGMVFGILMYMFIFIYGAQIMQGIIEEKTSKVVEVIVSSVRPFQLMMGKILGLATVGLLQFLIWIILMTTLTILSLKFFGVAPGPAGSMASAAQPSESMQVVTEVMDQPWGFILFCFLFYFLGGYLIYGALFAAVGSAVDSPAEAQQFMFPVTLPMLISYLSLFTFILREPNSPVSIWLSIIPFTSPIAMMGRLGSDVPMWQLILSMVLLIAGFVFTTWVAGRIYRVGILMSGTKVNYKVLAKWFLMKG
jgi:ABC-2 type transport system permease protein